MLASGDAIGASDLHLPGSGSAPPKLELPEGLSFGDAKRQTVERFEREFLLGALRDNEGNVSRTAQAIGMVRQSLQQMIRELGLRSEDWSQGNNRPANGRDNRSKTGNGKGEEK